MLANNGKYLWPLSIAGALCACASAKNAPAVAEEKAATLEVERAPLCTADTLSGTWLLKSGTATLSCDDGSTSVSAAGGSIAVLPVAGTDRLQMTDGACAYAFVRDVCSLKSSSNKECDQDGTPYRLQELALSGAASGLHSMIYRLSHPDPAHPGAECIDETRAELIRAVTTEGACALEGQWGRTTDAWGESAEIHLIAKGDQCSLQLPEYKGKGQCRLNGRTLVWNALTAGKGPSCGVGKSATYTVTFAAGCQGLVLEAKDDPCEARRNGIEYLYLAK